jgi:glycerophosphoryl diester phosphodiesterase
LRGRFSILGHRGAAKHAPENTAASLRAGLAAGADAIEVDLGACSDGRVVLLHDTTLDRTTSGRGPLRARTFPEVASLDAGSWFSRRFAGSPPSTWTPPSLSCAGASPWSWRSSTTPRRATRP